MINLLIAVVIGIILARICQWLMMMAGFVVMPLFVLVMQRQKPVLENGAIAFSVLLRSYIALSFSTVVIKYVQFATVGKGLAIASVTWPIAFLIANTPAWNSLRNFLRQSSRGTNDMAFRSGGVFEQARSRRLHEDMNVHFSLIHYYVLISSVIGFLVLTAVPALRAVGWGWVEALFAMTKL